MYQNTGFESHSSTFTDVSNAVAPSTVVFTNRVKQAPIAGGLKQPMTNGALSLSVPFLVPGAAGTRDTVLNESIKISWNCPYKQVVNLEALLTEVTRLFELAIADYNLAAGLIPTPSATLSVP